MAPSNSNWRTLPTVHIPPINEGERMVGMNVATPHLRLKVFYLCPERFANAYITQISAWGFLVRVEVWSVA